MNDSSKPQNYQGLLRVYRLRSLFEWQDHAERTSAHYRQRHTFEKELEEAIRHSAAKPTLRGYSYPAQQVVDFNVSISEMPCNWRETVVCPVTGLNNRVRGALHVFDMECAPHDDDRVYIMEQTTAAYEYLRQRFPELVGSEYLGNGIPSGKVVEGIRHENATQLSFDDESLDQVLHFDVFEHVPAYRKGFEECYRVLRHNGNLLWTVPFICSNRHNIVRAILQEDGTLKHLLEPEYHGDPMQSGGVLCYYHFGWELLSEVRQVGFKEVYSVVFWSQAMGYLGPDSIVFVAHK